MTRRAARQALRPSSLFAIAAPFAAGAVLSLALEARAPGRALRENLGGHAAGLAGELEEARAVVLGSESSLDPETVRAVGRLANEAARFAERLEAGEAAEDGLARLELDFDELLGQSGLDEVTTRALQRARRWLDAAQLAREEPASGLPENRDQPDESGAVASADVEGGEPEGARAQTASGPAGAAANGAASGAAGEALGPEDAGAASSTSNPTDEADLGVAAPPPAGWSGRYWPAHLDPVVSAWIDADRPLRSSKD